MTTTNNADYKKLKVKKLMIINARAYNKELPESYLSQLRIKQLLCFVHPQDRVRLETLYEDEQNALREKELEMMKNTKAQIKRTKYGE
jgi:hypothetical protein